MKGHKNNVFSFSPPFVSIIESNESNNGRTMRATTNQSQTKQTKQTKNNIPVIFKIIFAKG
jgi:hypothetical protein